MPVKSNTKLAAPTPNKAARSLDGAAMADNTSTQYAVNGNSTRNSQSSIWGR